MELKSKYSNEIFILDAYNKSFYLIILNEYIMKEKMIIFIHQALLIIDI